MARTSKYCDWRNYLCIFALIIATNSIFNVWILLFYVRDISHLINTAQSTTSKSNDNIAIQQNNNTNAIIEESCMPASQDISLLPSWNDPQTKIIRSTMLRHIIPPLFISFGGSGNTFVRALIEYVTKIYTGSIYYKEFNNVGFDGSEYCVTETIIVKYHGEHMGKQVAKSIIDKGCICGCRVGRLHKQKVTMRDFRKLYGRFNPVGAIFLVRNPWDAFFALYQYERGETRQYTRHKTHIPLSKWNVTEFKQDINIDVDKWNGNINVMKVWNETNSPFVVIKFENIVSKDIEVKTKELLKIMKFLYRDEYYKEHEALFKHRIDCVWKISNTDKRLNSIHRDKAGVDQLNKTFAYQSLGKEFLCNTWKRLKASAQPFGYSSYLDISCE